MTAPLDGIRVIEIANFAAAPSAAAIMADLGAEVIKVEAIGGDPIRGLMKQAKMPEGEVNPDHAFQFINRGKKSIELNIDDPDGAQIARDLISASDIVIMNLLPQRRRRFGLDPDDLFAIKADLVIGLLSGYGEQGEETDRPGYDVTAFFARSGLLGSTTAPGSPPPHARPGQGDHTASLAFFGGLMTALRAKEVTGEGQVIESTLLRSATWTIALDLVTAIVDGQPAYERPRERAISATLEAFVCSDDRWIQFAMPEVGDAWVRFCKALDRVDLLAVEEYATARDRYRNMVPLLTTLEETVRSMPSSHWMPRLDEFRCIWAPINDSVSATKDPQVRATGAFETINHPEAGEFETVAAPFRMQTSPEVGVRGPAPSPGQHTDDVLTGLLDLTDEQLADLEARGVISRG